MRNDLHQFQSFRVISVARTNNRTKIQTDKNIDKQGDLDDAREITTVWCWNDKKKQLNFVAAILAFFNEFWPNLVDTYKIHFWINFVLCVVFKCQHFLELFLKKAFFTIYIHISKGRYSVKNCSIDQIFFPKVQNIPIKFDCSLRSIQMSMFF